MASQIVSYCVYIMMCIYYDDDDEEEEEEGHGLPSVHMPMLQGIITPTCHFYTGTNFKLYVVGYGLPAAGLENCQYKYY